MIAPVWVQWASAIMEAAGVAVIVVGAVVTAVWALQRGWREGRRAGYIAYRHGLGRSILLGLELLVAADIIRTVSEIPTLSQVAVLAAIVAIRTFLSWSLEVELEGRWPWRRGGDAAKSAEKIERVDVGNGQAARGEARA